MRRATTAWAPVRADHVDIEDVHRAVAIGVTRWSGGAPIGRHDIYVKDVDRAVEIHIAGQRTGESHFARGVEL